MDFLIEHDPLDHAHLVTASGELDVPAAPQRGVGGRALGGGGGPPRRGGRAAPPDTSAPRTAAAPRPGALAPMTATLRQPTSAPAHAPPRRRLRERIARAERPLLHGGLALVTVHLLVLGVVTGLLTFGFGVVSHGLHVVNSGPDWRDLTGVGMAAGGLLVIASGL